MGGDEYVITSNSKHADAHKAAHDLDEQVTQLRILAVACRGSVKTDLNAYERLLVAKQKHGEQQTPTYIAAEAEARRLFLLLAEIDALAPTTPNVLADRREPIGEASSPKGDGRAPG